MKKIFLIGQAVVLTLLFACVSVSAEAAEVSSITDGRGIALVNGESYTIGQPIEILFNGEPDVAELSETVAFTRKKKASSIHIENAATDNSNKYYSGSYLRYYFNSDKTPVTTGKYTIDFDVKNSGDINASDGKWGFFYSSVVGNSDTRENFEIGRMWFRADKTQIYNSWTALSYTTTLDRERFYHITYELNPSEKKYTIYIDGIKLVTTDLRGNQISYIDLGSYLLDANRSKTVIDICNLKITKDDGTRMIDLSETGFGDYELQQAFEIYNHSTIESSVSAKKDTEILRNAITAAYNYDSVKKVLKISPIGPVEYGDDVVLNIGADVYGFKAVYDNRLTVSDIKFTTVNGTEVLALPDDYSGLLTASVNLKNRTTVSKNPLLILFTMDSTGIDKTIVNLVEVAANSTTSAEISVNITAGQEAKLYIWSEGELIPLIKPQNVFLYR